MNAWTITRDCLADPDARQGTNGNAVGIVGPRGTALTAKQIAEHPDAKPFRMADDDGNPCYEGFLIGDEFAPLTEENVFGFFEQTCASFPDLIKEALREVFKWLTPSQLWTGCKTSNEFKIGKKVVLCHVARLCYSGGLQVDYDRRPQVDALGNALSMLDGKGVRKNRCDKEEDRKLTGSYTDAWDHAWNQGIPYEDGYLIAKAFRNRNVHVTFKRDDLVEKINQAGAEAALQKAGREETRGFSH